MAEPTNRAEFAEYCLRRLGKPVITIDVAATQVEDRIQDALNYFYDYHFDGSEKTYYKHMITQEDIDERQITLPDNILGVVRIYPSSSFSNSYGLFDIRYQIALNDLYSLTTKSMVPYYMAMQHLSLLEQLLVGERAIRYNRRANILYIDTNWQKYKIGDFLVVEATSVVDPEIHAGVYSDRWLKHYATSLIKKQWASNLGKFREIPLMGGMVLNGAQLYAEAQSEIEKLEREMINSYSIPVGVYIG